MSRRMRSYLMTRGTLRRMDYAFLDESPPERWWEPIGRWLFLEAEELVLARRAAGTTGLLLSGIPSGRCDVIGTRIRYTVVVDDVHEDPALAAWLVRCGLEDAERERLGRALDAHFDAEYVDARLTAAMDGGGGGGGGRGGDRGNRTEAESSEEVPEQVSEQVPEQVSEQVSEHVSGKASKDISEAVSEGGSPRDVEQRLFSALREGATGAGDEGSVGDRAGAKARRGSWAGSVQDPEARGEFRAWARRLLRDARPGIAFTTHALGSAAGARRVAEVLPDEVAVLLHDGEVTGIHKLTDAPGEAVSGGKASAPGVHRGNRDRRRTTALAALAITLGLAMALGIWLLAGMN